MKRLNSQHSTFSLDGQTVSKTKKKPKSEIVEESDGNKKGHNSKFVNSEKKEENLLDLFDEKSPNMQLLEKEYSALERNNVIIMFLGLYFGAIYFQHHSLIIDQVNR